MPRQIVSISHHIWSICEGNIILRQVYGYQGIKTGKSSEQLLGSFVADLDTKSLETPLVIGKYGFPAC